MLEGIVFDTSNPRFEFRVTMNVVAISQLACYDTLLISLIVRVPSFTHAQDSFLLSPLLKTCPYDASSIMQTFLLIQWRVPMPRHPFVFHLFLDGPLLLRTISLLFSDDASLGRVIHYVYLSYSYDDASLRRVTLRLLRWRVPTTRHLICTCI